MTERITVTENDYGWLQTPSYGEIVATFGEILAEASDDDYQGDSLFLIREAGNASRYGILTFGWGSCSGCDALQACDNQEDVNNLQDDLERGIKWFENLDAAKSYLAEGGLKDSYLRESLVFDFGAKVAEVSA